MPEGLGGLHLRAHGHALPDILCSAGGKRAASATLETVPLSTAVEKHPWLQLTRGKCAACVAGGVAAHCTHDIVQCEERSLEVPWPPPAQRPPEDEAEEAPGPAACNHWGTATGWYLGIPAHFRGGFPVVEYAPGSYAYMEPAYMVPAVEARDAVPAAEGRDAVPAAAAKEAQVPMCKSCFEKKGSVPPETSFAVYPYGDPTRCAAALAATPAALAGAEGADPATAPELLPPLTFIEKVIAALVRPYNFLLIIKQQVEKGMLPFVTGHTLSFPQTKGVAEGDYGHLSHLFNHPLDVLNCVQLLGPEKSVIDTLRDRLLGSGELKCRPRVLLAWMHLFRVGNPDVWKAPLAYLDVSEDNTRRLQGLGDALCSEKERITDTSGFGSDFAAMSRSDVAGVRQGGLPPATDSKGMPLPEASEGSAGAQGGGTGASGGGSGGPTAGGAAPGGRGTSIGGQRRGHWGGPRARGRGGGMWQSARQIRELPADAGVPLFGAQRQRPECAAGH